MKSLGSFSDFTSKYKTPLVLFSGVLVILIYAQTLGTPFIFDDKNNIESNPHIRISQITLKGLTKAAFDSPSRQRPLANISFALNYYLHGYNVVGFRIVNILIHIITGILLYFFVQTTFRTPALRSRYANARWLPFFAAIIWMVHPVQTQSVSYIVQRMNSLSAMFYILSMLLYACFRLTQQKQKKGWLLSGCILTFILAIGSKQNAVTLPFFVFVYEWYFFQNLSPSWLKRHILGLAVVVLLLLAFALIYLGVDPVGRILASYDYRPFTPTQRVWTEFRVVIFYLSLLFWPHPARLNLDHDFALSHTLIDPITTLFSVLTIASMLAFAVITARNDRLVSFCIVWFFGNLVLESSIVGLEIIFEHRLYLPSMMFSLILVVLVDRWVKPVWLKPMLLCAAVMLGTFWSYQRNAVWIDRITIWQDSVAKSPQKARPHNNLGVALAEQGRHDEAIAHYLKALQINPSYPHAYSNLGLSLVKKGKLEDGINHFLKALEINPKDYEAHSNLGVALIMQERYEAAMAHLYKALKIKPHFAQAHNNLGVALQRQNRMQAAAEHFSIALQLDPDYAEAYNNLGVTLAKQGRFEEAIEYFSAALQIDPGYAKARHNLEKSLKDKNN